MAVNTSYIIVRGPRSRGVGAAGHPGFGHGLGWGWPTGRVRSDTGRNNKNLIVCYRGSAGLALMMMTTMWMIRKPIMAQLYVASDGLQVAVLAGTSHTQNDDTYI